LLLQGHGKVLAIWMVFEVFTVGRGVQGESCLKKGE
jgi:hypothetical protein